MAERERLRDYRGKSDFGRTGEPRGRGASSGDRPRFVVRIHDASTMHFDFRLQVDDVLKPWSVPKGPSADPKDKRLAVPTEDHPLEYEEFEGVVPRGEYGGGTVIVWDRSVRTSALITVLHHAGLQTVTQQG
ncbi:DNA polymerase ligase N-terminal domain-containing protein, partial [Streptomyces sp. NPDC056948]|uniref:DNA polymerase ligase N-terminal domain-containing protein n=1 Tax=Streptomyces sp. NPDC056948 TaxID=3345975 RepID=UPI003633BBF1